MAAEIHRLIGDVLEKLGSHDNDRRFLEGVEEMFAGYLEQTAHVDDAADPEPELPVPRDADGLLVASEPEPEPVTGVSASIHEIPIERLTPPSDPTGPTAPLPTAGPQPERPATPEQERIRLAGRLGAVPSFRRTPKGMLIGTLRLGVHREEDGAEVTDWRTVLAFGERAEKLRAANLARGQAVECVGFTHLREGRAKPGQPPKLIEEIYAVAIKVR